MGLTAVLSEPFFTGGATAGAQVPGAYPVALNGRGFLVDLDYPSYAAKFHHQSIPLLRPQQDTADELGERSLNPEALWRRSQDDWSHGAGQTYLDRKDSDRARFRSSKGIDPWTKWQISLLNDTSSKRTSVNTNLYLANVGGYLYLTDGSSILRTASLTGTPSWTAVTGGTGNPVSIATDGYNVYTAHTGNGIYKTTRGAGSTSSYVTGNVTLVGYCKGRLMAAYQNSIYNPTGAGALPSALFTHGNSDFAWIGFAAGKDFLYAAGYSGDKSLIYATQVKTDGTALDAPHVAAELPDGETVRSIVGYLGGYILIGTDKGVRFAQEDSTSGGLGVGKLISIPSPVYCFEPQDRFVWFGWTNYDSTSTGLGRLDLSVFAEPLAPAYASDLMATAQGQIVSIATFSNLRVFTVSGVGVFAQSTSLVSTGTLDTGLITYDLADLKVGVFLDVKHREMPAGSSHQAWLAGDDGIFTSVGIHHATDAHDQFSIPQTRAEAFEVREQINRGTDTTQAPVITRHTLKSEVTADPGATILVPFIIAEELELLGGRYEHRDVQDDVRFIKDLRVNRSVIPYQEGTQTYQVTVDDYDFLPYELAKDGSGYRGTMVAKLKLVNG